ncbi:YdeI family protein [Pseudoroseicyclus sp. CXY001]|uniref:YdeI/OmpD-associated family protein n=1 Tax=Pseudoroseicyclus sp. CXY001 TaxID=3242492 RepID=UPI0035716C64
MTKADEWYASREIWVEERRLLRRIVRATEARETWKWNQPCYVWGEGAAEGNVCVIWGYKDHCAVGFHRGVLLSDPEGVLVAPGKHSRAMRKLVFGSLEEVEAAEGLITAYVEEAIQLVKDGREVELEPEELDYPEELVAALEGDPELQEAWEALTPGRQRGYVIHISDAKRAETRERRIEKWRPAILQGKGMHD